MLIPPSPKIDFSVGQSFSSVRYDAVEGGAVVVQGGRYGVTLRNVVIIVDPKPGYLGAQGKLIHLNGTLWCTSVVGPNL